MTSPDKPSYSSLPLSGRIKHRLDWGRLMFSIARRESGMGSSAPDPVGAWVRTLRRDGIVVIPDFLSGDEIEALQGHLDAIDLEALPEGGYHKVMSRVWRSGRDFRLWHVDRVSEAVRDAYAEREIFQQIAEAFYGVPGLRESTIYQRTYESHPDRWQRRLGAQGLHFDTIYSTLKIFLYLDDVPSECGPYCYVPGTQQLTSYGKFRKLWDFYLDIYGLYDSEAFAAYYSDEEEERYGLRSRLKEVTGKKGTLILTNTRGLHRAGTIAAGHERGVLVNTYRASTMPHFPMDY